MIWLVGFVWFALALCTVHRLAFCTRRLLTHSHYLVNPLD